MGVHKERRMGEDGREKGTTVHPDDPAIPEHWHDQYLTENGVRDIIARYVVGGVLTYLGVMILSAMWAMSLRADVTQNAKDLERVRVEGTVPVQQIRNDLTRISTQMEGLSAELKDTRAALEKVKAR